MFLKIYKLFNKIFILKGFCNEHLNETLPIISAFLVKTSKLKNGKQHDSLTNETSGFQIPSLRIPKKQPNLSFISTPITPARFYKDKTTCSRRGVEVVKFVRVEVFSLERNCIFSPHSVK